MASFVLDIGRQPLRKLSLSIALQQVEQTLHEVGILLPISCRGFGGQVGIGNLAQVEVRIAQHVEQLRSHGSGLRQLFRRIGPALLAIANLAHFGDCRLVVGIVCEFCLELILGRAQVAESYVQYSLIGMSSANSGFKFQRMMKTAEPILVFSHR